MKHFNRERTGGTREAQIVSLYLFSFSIKDNGTERQSHALRFREPSETSLRGKEHLQ